jgi:cation:H+ antiporter
VDRKTEGSEDNVDAWIEELIENWPLAALFGVGAACVLLLGWAADWLVKEAVALSERSGVPKVVIGATVVSLGTTVPEAAVSVVAALQGNAELALGNAVGSIICDTGLILGIACLIRPLVIPRSIVNRQGWVQLGSGVLLVAWSLLAGDALPQTAGFVFLGLLLVYLLLSARWSRHQPVQAELEDFEQDVSKPAVVVLLKLAAAIALVVVASTVLIPTVTLIAKRLDIPNEVIAATLVAFGTSLPELVTAVTAARHGHGDLAVGNIIGADILNVLFVAGAAAAVTPDGLAVSPRFVYFLFPAMLAVLIIFRVGVFVSKETLSRRFGLLLLAVYAAVTVGSLFAKPPG